MSDVVIRADNVGKRYRLRHQQAVRYTALREVLIQAVKRPFLGRRHDAERGSEDFWALKDISFEVRQGTVLGVIGRNGAGKSTLLKILSRITEPTEGRIELHGRVASLLEVGTGFHPELTGRENIFLNGAILGMRRAEVAKRFDEIVAFSEVERFLDTPVKHYSSGMYVRLAFAVAAHLDQDIVLVDEVLAVGDLAFQRKCLGKMEDISKTEGRTVLFVSHNVTAISSLCTHAIYLSNGALDFSGSVEQTIDRYVQASLQSQRAARAGGTSILQSARLLAQTDSRNERDLGTTLTLEFVLALVAFEIGIDVIIRPAHGGDYLLHCGSAYFSDLELGKAQARVVCDIGPVNYALGPYEVDVRICKPMEKWIEEHDAVLKFDIEHQSGARRGFELASSRRLGCVIPRQRWRTT